MICSILIVAKEIMSYSKPSVVYVFVDQWRAHPMAYAGNSDVKTSNFDRLGHSDNNRV